MMDWAAIIDTAGRLDTLDVDERTAQFERLTLADPESGAALRDWFARTGPARSFMQTSAPGFDDPQTEALDPGTRIGPWRIERLLGAGGMGEVYEAARADGGFDQRVALKLAKTTGRDLAARFQRERQRLARLDHPGIARIVDGGTDASGHPYMTMEYVDGQPIDAFVRERKLDRPARIVLLRELCAALAHAHARLILHRDVKPDNVLVDAGGRVRLIDFGVASLLDGAADSGPGALTLACAAPEQLEGGEVSTATDIFAVGLLAHLLVTGRLPQRRADGGVAVDETALGDADLSAIVAKATAADPQARYGSVDALADDLADWRGGFPVAARPLSPAARTAKALRRNPKASLLGAGLLASLVVGLVAVSIFAVRAEREAEASRIARGISNKSVELYETANAGFTGWLASIDPQSDRGQAIFAAFRELEKSAAARETEAPQEALEIYVFLADLYADSGLDADASRIGERLAGLEGELGYPAAFTLDSMVHLSQGYVEDAKLVARLDRLHEFFLTKPKIYSFEAVMNRCVKGRITMRATDQRTCVNDAGRLLAANPDADYAARSANLSIQAYAIDNAVQLGDFDRAESLARDALAFFDGEDRPSSVPEAVFWMALSDIAQSRAEWSQSRGHLLSARRALAGMPEAQFFEAGVYKELSETQRALGRFDEAADAARRGKQVALDNFGPDHWEVRDMDAQLAMALAGLGDPAGAVRLMEQVIATELAGDADPNVLKIYRGMLAEIGGDS